MPESAGPGDLLCGVDIGTTSIKAVLVTWDGSVVSVAKAPTPVLSDGYGPCHDPEEIRATAEQVMGQALRESTVPGWIAAIGVTSVGEEGVPLGPGGELLYPSIAWYDRRPSEAEEKWSAQHADEEMFAVTGLHKDLGFTIYKWLWLKSAQPSVWSRCRSWLGIADYVIWRWTGQQGMSVSHASRTGIFELRAFRWQQDWAAAVLAGGADVLPPLREAGSPVGFLRPGAIPGLATTGEIPVVATGLDHAVGAYAAGVTHPGQVLDSMGTAEALIEPVPVSYLAAADYSLGIDFGAGILPGTHIAIAGFESGAGIAGILQALGAASVQKQQQLESEAARLAPGADGLVYVPPRMRSRTGGALLGHKISHDAAHLYRSVVEGWALAAEHALSSLGSGDRLRDVVCIGGGSMSALRTRVKASIFGQEMRCLTTPEIVAVGAALLAGQAPPPTSPSPHTPSPRTGTTAPSPRTGAAAGVEWKPATSVVAPVPDWVPPYRALIQEFRRLAPMIHPDAGPHVYP